jgi:trehalose 6-phosphate synthase/phosphatase
MLQHLWTGPISNAAVDVVQGGKSVEVRPVGVSKVFPLPNMLGKTFSLLCFKVYFLELTS